MLRKDVKLGLSVGGVLLAVVIVYVLVVPGSQQPGEPEASMVAPSEPTGAAEAEAIETPAANQPATTDPFAPQVEVASAGGAGQADDDSGTDWHKLLYGQPALLAVDATLQSGAGPTTRPRPASAPRRPDVAAVFADPQDAATPVASGGRTHLVQPNETLSSISKAAYGSANYYPHILRANPGLDPKRLRPGMSIKLPDERDVKPQAAARAGTSELASVSSPSSVASSEYRVQSNDSLYAISMRLYGKADRVDRLYELNRQTIGPNPAALKVGMVLKLPEPATIRTN